MRTTLQRCFGAAAQSARARPRTTPTILIAEDSTDSREMMGLILQFRGYKVLLAENGPSAVAVALTNRPDMILLDLELPKLDGFAVVRSLRGHREFESTPMIIVSGHDLRQNLQPALDAGCTDYLMKPIDFDRLDVILQTNAPLSP